VEPGDTAKTRAPGLDGVRALAVLAVIGFHEGASELPGGFLGVDLFFVLSGFLITDLLVARYAETGRLDPAAFGRAARCATAAGSPVVARHRGAVLPHLAGAAVAGRRPAADPARPGGGRADRSGRLGPGHDPAVHTGR
jgi:hypothetical protein